MIVDHLKQSCSFVNHFITTRKRHQKTIVSPKKTTDSYRNLRKSVNL